MNVSEDSDDVYYQYRQFELPDVVREEASKRIHDFDKLSHYLKVKYYLLERESKNKVPPKWRYDNDRGTFDIAFETEAYKHWVKWSDLLKFVD